MVHYIRKNNYETAYFDGEWIILDTDNYTLTKLNETGGFCWSLLNEIQSIDTLSEAIFQHFDPKCDDVKVDIKVFLEGLLECGLIKSVV